MSIRKELTNQKQQHWKAHIDGWKESGKTQAGYCREHELKIKTFSYWMRKLNKKPTAVKLVQVPPLPITTTPIRLILEDRFAIEINDGFNPATLSRIVEVVRGL